METDEIRRMTRAEAQSALEDAERSLWNLKFRQVTQHVENPLVLRSQRREVARIKTILREDQLGLRNLAATTASAAPEAEAENGDQ